MLTFEYENKGGVYMYTRAELKQNAKNALKGKWGSAILASILSGIVILIIYWIVGKINGIITGIIGEGVRYIFSLLLALLQIAIVTPVTVGLYSFFLKLTEENKPEVGEIFSGFKNSASNSMIMGVLIYVYTLLWTLLFIIPGVIKSFSYSMSYYIMAENPTISAEEAITKSRELMNGHKAELFFLELSFIGWAILATLTCGIGYIWLTPYMSKTMANFYQAIKQDNIVQVQY